jgi:hypothetical protein
MFGEEFLEPGQSGGRFGKGIKPEFKKLRVLQSSLGPLHQFRRRAALDGDADLSQP